MSDNSKKEDCKHKLQKCYDEDGNLFAHWCYKCGSYWKISGGEKETVPKSEEAICKTDMELMDRKVSTASKLPKQDWLNDQWDYGERPPESCKHGNKRIECRICNVIVEKLPEPKSCQGCIHNEEFTGICRNKEGICVDHNKYKPIVKASKTMEFLLGDDLRITFDAKGIEIETFDENDSLVIGTLLSHEDFNKMIKMYQNWRKS